jgi:hypothetical protein
MKTRLANLLVLGSIATNLAIVAYGASLPDSMTFFRKAFPVVLLVGVLGGVGALLNARELHERAKQQFAGTKPPGEGDA